MAVLKYLDIVLGAKTDKLDTGLAAGKGKVTDFSKSVKTAFDNTSAGSALSSFAALGPAGIAAGAAVAGGLAVITTAGAAATIAVRGIGEQLGEIDAIGDSAKRMGMQFSELVDLRLAFGRSSGLDEGTIDASLQKMQLNLREAQSGSGDLANTLQSLGLDAGQLIEAGPVEAIKQISKASQDLKSPLDQSKLAFDLFGKSGVGLVTVLRDGPEAIDEMANRAKQLGLELSQAQVEQVGAANDAWEDLQLVATGAFRQIAAEVAPVITTILNSVNEVGTSFSGWQQSLPQVIDGAVYLAGAFYDVYEVINLSRMMLNALATGSFLQAATIANFGGQLAADFGTGQNWVDQINANRQAAANAASKPVTGEIDTTAFEAEKEAREKAAELTKKNADQVADRLNGMRDEVSLLGQSKDAMERLRLSRLGATEAQLKEFDALAKTRTEREKAEEAAKAGKAMTERLRSPAEQFKADMEELKQLKEANAIDQVTYLRGKREAIVKRDKAMERPEPPKIGFLQQGSVAAYSQALANEKNGAQEKGNALLAEIDATLKRLEGKPAESGLKQI